MLSIKKILNWRILPGAAGRQGGFHSQPREWHSAYQNNAGELCVVGVNEHVSVVEKAWGSLAPNN